MRRRKHNVLIQEPPIQEIGKRRSCLKRTCITGCGCIVLFIIGIIAILQFVGGPRAVERTELPVTITEQIPLYDQDALSQIEYIPGVEKNRLLEIAAIIPKLFLSPIILTVDEQFKSQTEGSGTWERLRTLIEEPIGDHRDTYTLVWSDLSATPTFIVDFYSRQLKRNGFTIFGQGRGTNGERTFEFKRGQYEGTFTLQNSKQSSGTDHLEITITLPIQ